VCYRPEIFTVLHGMGNKDYDQGSFSDPFKRRFVWKVHQYIWTGRALSEPLVRMLHLGK
jgi:hypothetical protein